MFLYYFSIEFANFQIALTLGPEREGEHEVTSSLRSDLTDGLALLQQWAELDRNGFLASHVGGATNIFGVSGEGGAGRSGAQEREDGEEGVDIHGIGEGDDGNGGEEQQDTNKGVEDGGDGGGAAHN